jgi:U6 snRNA-associated Sm-like protein LSm4
MVDTRNGESYDGMLEGCDNFMNFKLSDVTITSAHGTFSKCPLAFIRGNNIKSIQLEDEIIEKH